MSVDVEITVVIPLATNNVTDENGQDMDNAFWNGQVLTYGDGDPFDGVGEGHTGVDGPGDITV